MTLRIDQTFTPNCEPRADGKTIRHLILHYTGCPADRAAARFLDPTPNAQGGRLSTHYMVHESGRVTQFVHEKMRAWHAGRSYWAGETDINSTSIGIEIENLGEYADYPPFGDVQIQTVIALCQNILERNPGITPRGVLGHSDIAPGRKLDPGPVFPWERLAAAGVGVYPGVADVPPPPLRGRDGVGDPNRNTSLSLTLPLAGGGDQTALIQNLLTQFGYNPDVPFDTLWQAFCTHYAPEGLRDGGRDGAVLKLENLIAQA